MRKIITTFVLGVAMFLGAIGGAEAAPVKGKSVCETGHRGQKSYDAKCLTTGTVMDGVNLWFKADGKNVSRADRKALCRDATSTGHTRAAIMDALFDVAYDSYRNHTAMLKIAGTVGTWDCKAMGLKIKK